MGNDAIDAGWLEAVAARMPGAEFGEKAEWEAYILSVGGKQFARLGTDSSGSPVVTVKGDPLENEALRQEFDEVVPGYYSNKRHWISVHLAPGTFPEDRLRELVEASYALVFASLTKRVRDGILAPQ